MTSNNSQIDKLIYRYSMTISDGPLTYVYAKSILISFIDLDH